MFKGRTERRKGDQRKGFTLVELMIVIAIIAILAAVALNQYKSYKRKAKSKDLIGIARACALEFSTSCASGTDNVTASDILAACNVTSTSYLQGIEIGYKKNSMPSAGSKATKISSSSTTNLECSNTYYFVASGQLKDETNVYYSGVCSGNKTDVKCQGIIAGDLVQ